MSFVKFGPANQESIDDIGRVSNWLFSVSSYVLRSVKIVSDQTWCDQMQRLEDEYDAQVLITTPSVPYKLKLTENSPTAKLHGSHEVEITNPSKWPAVNEVKAYYEPVVKATIICPVDYQSDIFGLCSECRGTETGKEDSRYGKTSYFAASGGCVHETFAQDFFPYLKS